MSQPLTPAERGKLGGRPAEFPPCSLRLNNAKVRHRFHRGLCRCGVVNAPGFYKLEDGVWYQKDGKDWKKI